MSTEWWYLRNGAVMGPTATFHLASMVRQRVLNADDWAWQPELPGWTQIQHLPTLRSDLPATSVTAISAQGPDIPLPDPAAERPARPLSRLLAQGIDFMAGATLVGLISWVWYGVAGQGKIGINLADFTLAFCLLPATLLLQAFMVALFGNTLGKRSLGLRIRRRDGRRPGLITMLIRQVWVWIEGFGLGLHLIALFIMPYSRYRLLRGQRTRWDQGLDLVVLQQGAGWSRHPLGPLMYSLTASMLIALPNPLRALAPEPMVDHSSAYSMPQTTSATWHNPVTGKNAKLVTGWEMATEPREQGGNSHWLWKTGREGRGMIERDFLQDPFPDFYTDFMTDTGQAIPAALPTPAPGQPVCMHHISTLSDDPEQGTMEELRVCVLSSGEIWRIHGWWPMGDEAEQSRVKSLMDGLETTIR